MTAEEIVEQLKPLGSDAYKKTLRNHGIKEPFFGVKIEELKKFQKKIKKDYRLALDLFNTGIYDAMYLAGLIADDLKMTKSDLQHWVATANCATVSEYTVPWVAAESLHGRELALEWIESKKESVASSGWATLSGLVAIKDDAELDLAALYRSGRRSARLQWTWAAPRAKSRTPRTTSKRSRNAAPSARSARRRNADCLFRESDTSRTRLRCGFRSRSTHRQGCVS